MKTLITIEKGKKGIRTATTIAKDSGDLNRLSVIFSGTKGYINKSGAILCRSIEASKIMSMGKEVSEIMLKQFGSDFKKLYIVN